MEEQHIISHPKYGEYVQKVFDTPEEAGHKPLPSGGKYGWEMPSDPAAEEFVGNTKDRVVFEVGSGLGNIVVLPSLKQGAALVYAADVDQQSLSIIAKEAEALGRMAVLKTQVLDRSWWESALQANPSVSSILSIPARDAIPLDGSVELMIARHSLQFGDPEKFLRFLDLAAAALKVGGAVTGINFTPYTQYLYAYDKGETLKRVVLLNSEFAEGKVDLPGGFIDLERGAIHVPLARLMGREELSAGKGDTFLYFDRSTIIGLLRIWSRSREKRGLPTDLEIAENFYFSPSRIWKDNKFRATADETVSQLACKENHVFILKKCAR